MHRLPLLLLAAVSSAACDEAFGDGGGDCAYEAVEPASCELVETADGLLLEATETARQTTAHRNRTCEATRREENTNESPRPKPQEP